MKATQLKRIRQKSRLQHLATGGLIGLLIIAAGLFVVPTIEHSIFVPLPIREVLTDIVPSTSTQPVSQATSTPAKQNVTLSPASTSVVTIAAADEYSGVGFSVGQVLLGLSSVERNLRLDDMKKLGLTWLRFDIEWSDVQPKNAQTYDWGKIDALIAAAHARGIEVLPILLYAPRWARSEACIESVRCAPKDPAQFATFAAAAALRFAPQGVHQWEIWNEPNLGASWLPKANPAQYAAFLKSSSAAIKKVDPSAHIVTGGLGPAATRGNDIAPIEFLRALYDAGAEYSFDAVGFHPYSFPASPGFPREWNAWQQMNNTNPSLRSVMIENVDEEKKIWVTEYGTPTGGPGGMSEDSQQSMITDAITLWSAPHFAGPLILYTYKDLGTNQDTKENFFGIIRYDGTQKPAYKALQTLLSQ